MDRRSFLRTTAALSGLAAVAPRTALAGLPLGGPRTGAARASRLQPANNLFLVHTDLHNHSLISGDADGYPGTAYAQMRARGIDVACLTEHAISGKDHGELTCPGHQKGGCHTIEGINSSDWQVMRYLADAANDEPHFVAFRGFEWSPGTRGHLNVWFSERFTDALHEHAFISPKAASEIDRIPGSPIPSEIADRLEVLPDTATMRFFYEWLSSPPDRPVLGGGNDGIGCFNHPNEFGDFEAFAFHPGAAQRIVSIEALNGDRDFFWFAADKGMPNPFNACLNAGWRVGFTGVSDEHSTEYGRAGMARGGLWVSDLTRADVYAALASRRTFATFEPGLRLDATANGMPMGSVLAFDEGTLSVALDLDLGPEREGTPLLIEVIRPGAGAPVLVQTVSAVAGSVATFDVPGVRRADGDWMFLRITDPARAPHALATEPYRSHGGAVAYASPWFLGAA